VVSSDTLGDRKALHDVDYFADYTVYTQSEHRLPSASRSIVAE
jgi:hypothetical protein